MYKELKFNAMITKNDLLELSRFHNAFCISIFIPTHHAGEHTLRGEDSINLKNQLKEVKIKLEEHGMNGDELKVFIKPVHDLISDNAFWRYQSEGLAIFLSHKFFRKYSVPVSFTEFNYLSTEFYLKPLLHLYNDDGLFYLLTLKKDEVKFYVGSKYSLTEINIEDLIPSRVEERVGYDYEQKQLQFRTIGSRGGASFHGHGESETSDKNELLLFFQAIDKGIMSKLHEFQESPLVVCCIDYYFPIYKEANTHKNLFPHYISYNPANLDETLLHEKARELLQPYFNKNLHKKKDKFMESLAKGKASSEIGDIIPAAVQGRVDTLFLEKNSDVFGVYDPEADEVGIQETPDLPGVSLTNLAAKRVFEQGGTVYIMDNGDMPDNTSEINALFRF